METATFAPRHRVWPPKGYVAPTAEEFAALLQAARSFTRGYTTRARWDKLSDLAVLRHLQLMEILPHTRGSDAKAATDYTHQLNRLVSKRKLTRIPSIALLRCESCSHATGRLFEAPHESHGFTDGEDKPITVWLCMRCWSRYAPDEAEGEE